MATTTAPVERLHHVLLTFAPLVGFGQDVPGANPITYYVLPVLGVLAIGFPLYQLVSPASRTRSTATRGSRSAS